MTTAEGVAFQKKVSMFYETWQNGRGSCHEAMVWILNQSAKMGCYSKQLNMQIWTGISHAPFDLESLYYVNIYISTQPPIYPSIFCQPLICVQVAEAAVSARGPRLPFPWPHQPALSGGPRGILRPMQRYNLSTRTWACPGASSQLDVPGTPP